MEWVLSFGVVWLSQAVMTACNPFLAPIAHAILNRQPSHAAWGAYLSGLLRDLMLFSPRLGVLSMSSLIATAVTYRLTRFLSLDGWQGTLIVSLLALVQFFTDILLCSLFSGADHGIPLLWTWRGCMVFVILSCLWALLLGAITTIGRWCTASLLRRSS